jgi:hypothetical protein
MTTTQKARPFFKEIVFRFDTIKSLIIEQFLHCINFKTIQLFARADKKSCLKWTPDVPVPES